MIFFMSKISEALLTFNEEKLSPLSIGFDAKRAFYNNSGLGNYSRNLLFALAKNNPGNSYYLFTPKTKDRFILENEGQFNLIEPTPDILKLIGPLWRLKYMVNDIRRQRLNIFHGLSHELPFGIEKSGAKSVVTVHDLIFIRFPELYEWINVKIYYWKLVHACRVSDHIVAISNQTKNDLISFLNVSPQKISVIHQGCNPYFWKNYSKESFEEIKIKHGLPEKYLLYVGTVEERKNLLGIIKAIHLTNISIPLVVIGRKVDNYYKKILNYITVHGLNKIIFREHILNHELPVIYRNAECFIYPSFFEGFGIPILEALVSKTPVITSKGGCFAEAAGPGSLYVDPNDPEMIGETILKVVNDKKIREEMIIIGADYANNFTDDIIARSYLTLYHSLLK
jgi:glycosyltransferase involved in cell wall biosynthesis